MAGTAQVMRDLDIPRFTLTDPKEVHFIVLVYRKAVPNSAFPLDVLFTPWTNVATQLSFLKHALVCSADVLSFAAVGRSFALPDGLLTKSQVRHRPSLAV